MLLVMRDNEIYVSTICRVIQDEDPSARLRCFTCADYAKDARVVYDR